MEPSEKPRGQTLPARLQVPLHPACTTAGFPLPCRSRSCLVNVAIVHCSRHDSLLFQQTNYTY
jgi:hypothetical protein